MNPGNIRGGIMQKRDNSFQKLFQLFMKNKGKIIGGFLGFVFAILFLVIGFFRTLLIIVCTIIGYILGASWEGKINFKKIIDDIFNFH